MQCSSEINHVRKHLMVSVVRLFPQTNFDDLITFRGVHMLVEPHTLNCCKLYKWTMSHDKM